MAIIEVRINESKIFKLCFWNTTDFENTQNLHLQCSDTEKVKNAFNDIEKLEIYISNTLVATYTAFDGCSSASLQTEKCYVEHEGIFTDKIIVTLTKKNLVEQIQRLEAQINEVVDIDSLTVDEYRNYLLKQIATNGQEDIFAGDYVQVSDGNQLFTYKMEDQQNLTNMVTLIDQLTRLNSPDIDINSIKVPYHSSGQSCNLYTVSEMMKVYTALFMRSLRIQTYCNAVNILLNEAQSKEKIQTFYYGMELPSDSQKRVDEIVATSLALMSALSQKYSIDYTNIETEGGINESETKESV